MARRRVSVGARALPFSALMPISIALRPSLAALAPSPVTQASSTSFMFGCFSGRGGSRIAKA